MARMKRRLSFIWLKRVIAWASLDAIIIITAYVATYSIRTTTNWAVYRESAGFILTATGITLVWLYIFRVYQRIWQRSSGYSAISIANAIGTSTLIVLVMNTVFEPQPIPYSVILMANVMSLAFIVALRYRSRLTIGFAVKGRRWWFLGGSVETGEAARVTRVLIIGAGESGQTLAWRLQHRFHANSRYEVVGFIDDDPAKQNMYVEGRLILGDRTVIREVAQRFKIDLIVVAIHNIDGPSFRDILQQCEDTKARIKVMPDVMLLLDDTRAANFLRDVQPEDLIGRSIVERHSAVDLEPITGRVVLVTGAAGSIGSEISRQMATYEPIRLVLLDNSESRLHDLHIELSSKHREIDVVPTLVDVTDIADLQQVFEMYAPHVVFHAAAYKHVPMLERTPQQAIKVNVGGTYNLVRMAHEYAVQRFVLISTDKAVRPSSVMGASKRVCELVVHAQARLTGEGDPQFTTVRFGNVLGSQGSVVPTFNRQIDGGGPVTITHPEMTRYFMSIHEAANLVIHAACLTRGDDIFLLQMGESIRIQDIAERMIRLRGLRPHIDIPIEYIGVRPGEKLHEELHVASEDMTETAHPSIVRLDGWPDNLEPDAFFATIEDVLATDLRHPDVVLEVLHDLTGLQRQAISQEERVPSQSS